MRPIAPKPLFRRVAPMARGKCCSVARFVATPSPLLLISCTYPSLLECVCVSLPCLSPLEVVNFNVFFVFKSVTNGLHIRLKQMWGLITLTGSWKPELSINKQRCFALKVNHTRKACRNLPLEDIQAAF